MNLLKIHPYKTPHLLHPPQTTFLSHHYSLSHVLKFSCIKSTPFSPSGLFSRFLHRPTFKILRVSEIQASFLENIEEREGGKNNNLSEFEDLAPDGDVYLNTLRLVECSMFAAVTGLVYFLSNSLAIEVSEKDAILCAELLWLFLLITNSALFLEMGCRSWKENYGSNSNALICPVWSCQSIDISVNAWCAGFHNGLFVEVESKLGAFDFLVHNCSRNRCRGVCLNILILNTRKHTCFDHHKYPCFPHVHIFRCWSQHCPIDELDIYSIWDSGVAKFWIFCIPVAPVVFCVPYTAWDERFVEIAKLAGEGVVTVRDLIIAM